MAWAMTRVEDHIIDLMEPIEERRRHNEQRIAWQMKRAGERYARKEKAAKSGYQTNDEAYYESATLGQLLPFVIASVIDGTVTCIEGNTAPDKKGDQRNGGQVCLKVRAYKKKNGSKLRKSQPVAVVGFGKPVFKS